MIRYSYLYVNYCTTWLTSLIKHLAQHFMKRNIKWVISTCAFSAIIRKQCKLFYKPGYLWKLYRHGYLHQEQIPDSLCSLQSLQPRMCHVPNLQLHEKINIKGKLSKYIQWQDDKIKQKVPVHVIFLQRIWSNTSMDIKFPKKYEVRINSDCRTLLLLTIIQCFLICPVGPVLDPALFEVRVVLWETSVKYGYFYPSTWKALYNFSLLLHEKQACLF